MELGTTFVILCSYSFIWPCFLRIDVSTTSYIPLSFVIWLSSLPHSTTTGQHNSFFLSFFHVLYLKHSKYRILKHSIYWAHQLFFHFFLILNFFSKLVFILFFFNFQTLFLTVCLFFTTFFCLCFFPPANVAIPTELLSRVLITFCCFYQPIQNQCPFHFH